MSKRSELETIRNWYLYELRMRYSSTVQVDDVNDW